MRTNAQRLPYVFAMITAMSLTMLFMLTGCAHKKAAPVLTKQSLREKTVALAAVNGAKEARLQVEIAVVNEVISQGRFKIIDRTTVQEALVEHPTEDDWGRLGDALKADIILAIDILEFKTDKRVGYDDIEEEDSLLSAEHRESRSKKWRKLYKVGERVGYVKLGLKFYDVPTRTMLIAEESQAMARHNSREGDVPRAMKLLETLTAQAVGRYFDELP